MSVILDKLLGWEIKRSRDGRKFTAVFNKIYALLNLIMYYLY